ncbi:DNA primase family protein [Aliiruegeria sabulilitoris]|uniref:DNA primase family protein n=1 Tax=Aliiruegeria sabulilitoris TaxID=1510458 RepID=UPI0018D257EA|nr:phage/plasmid primase, P4 family [Aliiruegeria sabulilitoris]
MNFLESVLAEVETSAEEVEANTNPSAASPYLDRLTEDALAEHFVKGHMGGDARHVVAWGKWLFWSGTHWEADETLRYATEIRQAIAPFVAELFDLADASETGGAGLRKLARQFGSSKTVMSVASLARTVDSVPVGVEELDADLDLLATPGGMVNLRSGEIRPAKREDLCTKITSVAPAPPGTVPERWIGFLHRIFSGDVEMIRLLQEAAGYGLTGRTTEHKLLFLHGSGRNGKSVYLSTISRLAGDYAGRAHASTFIKQHNTQHPTDVAKLRGLRMVIASELPEGSVWNENVLKDLTGGETVSARYMRQDFFDFKPQLTLLIAGNSQPSLQGVDVATRERLVLVPFDVTIPREERDPLLEEKLIGEEGPAILRWMIDGAVQWYRHGLTIPESVRAASESYFANEDIVGNFLTAFVDIDPDGFASRRSLYNAFKRHCYDNGLACWTSTTFVKELRKRKLQEGKREGTRGFRGVRMRAAEWDV